MKKNSIKSNFFYNVMYEVFRIVVPLLTTPYISRILGANGVGIYTLSYTYAQYFILFAELGFSTYAARELAYVRDEEEKFINTFREIFLVRIILFIIAIVIYFLIFFVFNIKSDITYKICLIYVVASLIDVSYYFKAIENFKIVALRNIIIKLIAMIAVFIFVKQNNQVWLYTLILSISEIIGQLIMMVSMEKKMWGMPIFNRKNLKKHFKTSLTLFIPALAIQMYTMLDKVMIGEMNSESEVGYYENAQKMVRLAATVASAIVSVSVPRMSYYYSKDEMEKFKELFNKVCKFVSFLIFPMCFGLIAIASNFSKWYYGINFQGIDKLVILGAPLIISLGLSNIFGNMVLIATNNQKYYTLAVYTGAAINLCLNTVLIPKFGANGAMTASVIAEFVGMIIMFIFCQKKYNIFRCKNSIIKYLLVSTIMLIIIMMADRHIEYGIMSTCLEIILGFIIFGGVMVMTHDEILIDIITTIKSKLNKFNNTKRE